MSRTPPYNAPAPSRITLRAPQWVFGGIAALTAFLLLSIFLFLLTNAISAMIELSWWGFLFGTAWNPVAYGEPSWGIAGLLLSTIMIVAGSLVFSVPLGISTAIYLSQIASPKSREFLKPLVEMIAGIPSVVLGLLGLLYVAPLLAQAFGLSNGLNAFTASLLVGIVTIPSVASLCEDALTEIPRSLRDASLALGASRWTTIWRILLPAARSGIAASIMLGLGRAIGETMIVLMVAGNSLKMPSSFFDPVRPMTATIAIEIKEVVVGDLHWSSLFAIGLVLFVLTFGINILTDLLIRRRNA